MTCYTYTELQTPNTIRLLQLAPGKANEPLTGFLELVELDKAPDYVAVSYAWEGSEKSKVLVTPDGSIPITPSLYCALRNLRNPKADLCIWADAVCINQSDNNEKSSQVRFMGDIYSRAIGDMVDLDENVPERNVITRGIELIGTLARIPKDLYEPERNNMIAPWDFEKHGLPHNTDEAWQALGSILGCPWFLQVWVVQEFVLAKDVVLSCGGLAIPWRMLSDALLRCIHHNISRQCYLPLEDGDRTYIKLNTDAYKGMQAALMLIDMRNAGAHKRWPLLDLIEDARILLATRSRDHMFSFLGLASDAQSSVFNPDYQSPLHLVVLKYAREFVRVGCGPQLLHSAGLGHGNSKFPSWVPDWTEPARFFLGIYPRNLYQAAGRTVPHMMVMDMENILAVRGLTFDKIARLSRCAEYHATHDETIYQPLFVLLEECDEMLTDLQSYPTGEDLQGVYWRTLIGNMSRYPQEGDDVLEAPHSYIEQYDQWRDYLRKRVKNPDWTYADALTDAETTIFAELVGRMRLGSRFCVTEKGYIGFCHKITQCGDVIAIFLGCPVPYIIRKCDERENHFRLIGRSYIHGIMKGEACQRRAFARRI